MTAATATDPLDRILAVVSARTGMRFGDHQRPHVRKQVAKLVEQSGHPAAEYASNVELGRADFDALVDTATVGETYFFRDPLQFDVIRRRVLPALAARRGRDEPIRIWSAGCASGEEAYSLAILLDQEHLLERARILATDISPSALAKARKAEYGDWSLRGCDEAFVRRYFRRSGRRHVLDERIRRSVSFEILNLALDIYPAAINGTREIDLILCRNVLIYLDEATIGEIATKFHAALSADGWLLTGASDPILSTHAPFQPTVTDAGLSYRRRSDSPAEVHAAVGHSAGAALALRMPHPAGAARAAARRADVATHERARSRRSVNAPREPAPGTAGDAAAAAEAIRDVASRGSAEAAIDRAADATRVHPLSAELHLLYGTLLVECGRFDDARVALERAIYLERSMAIAHFILATLLQRRGEGGGAIRSYRNSARLATTHPADQPVPHADGESYGHLRAASERQIELLETVATVARNGETG